MIGYYQQHMFEVQPARALFYILTCCRLGGMSLFCPACKLVLAS